MAGHGSHQALICSLSQDLPQNREKKGRLVLGILDPVTALSQLILDVKRLCILKEAYFKKRKEKKKKTEHKGL